MKIPVLNGSRHAAHISVRFYTLHSLIKSPNGCQGDLPVVIWLRSLVANLVHLSVYRFTIHNYIVLYCIVLIQYFVYQC